jgi:uncharacterized protein YjiS (DUF1127 family)
MRDAIQKPAWQWLEAFVAGFTSALRRACDKLWKAMLVREAAAQLRAMNDYELKDIGIARCEIDYKITHPHEQRY